MELLRNQQYYSVYGFGHFYVIRNNSFLKLKIQLYVSQQMINVLIFEGYNNFFIAWHRACNPHECRSCPKRQKHQTSILNWQWPQKYKDETINLLEATKHLPYSLITWFDLGGGWKSRSVSHTPFYILIHLDFRWNAPGLIIFILFSLTISLFV